MPRNAVPPIDINEVRRVFRAPFSSVHIASLHTWGGRNVGKSDIPVQGHRVRPSNWRDSEVEAYLMNEEDFPSC